MKWAYISTISAIIGGGCLVGSVANLLIIKLGASEAYLGLFSFATIAPFVASILTLSHIERLGKRRVLLFWFGISSLFAIPFILIPVFLNFFGFTPEICLLIILVSTFLRSMTTALGLTGWFPILQDNVPKQVTGRFFGRLRTVWQIANFLFILFVAFFFGSNTDLWKFEVVFIVAFFFLLLRAAAVLPMTENRTVITPKINKGIVSRLVEFWKIRGLRIAAVYVFVYSFAVCAPLPFFIKMLKDLGYTDGLILAATSMMSLGAIVSLRWWGRIADSFGNHALFSLSHVGIVCAVLMWLLVENNPLGIVFVFVFYFVWNLFHSGNGVAQTRFLFHSVPEDKQYGIIIVNIAAGLGSAVGPLLGGIFLQLIRNVSFSSGGLNLNSYHIFFIIDAMLFVIPHILHYHLKSEKDYGAVEVISIVTRPFREAIGPFVSLGVLMRKNGNNQNSKSE